MSPCSSCCGATRYPAPVISDTWVQTLGSVAIVSAISLVGAATFAFNDAALRRSLLFLVSFAAGALLGDALIHLLPEAVEEAGGFELWISASVLIGIVALFLLEKSLHWHHAHFPSPEVLHPVAVTNIVGDALHNLVDGIAIAAGFLTSTRVGVATAVAVALHEIPQELGDFAILMHSGLKRRRALMLNFFSALTAFVGAIGMLVLADQLESLTQYLVPVIAGSFIYIGSTDLLPELHKEPELKKSAIQVTGLLVGIGMMALLLTLE